MGALVQFIVVAVVVIGAVLWLRRTANNSSSDRAGVGGPSSNSSTAAVSRRRAIGIVPQNDRPPDVAYDAEALVAEYQRQASERDRQRKDEIRSHVTRAVPPITDSGVAALERAQTSTLAIRHRFPPVLPQHSLSYLGGAPVTPPDGFDWPIVHNREGVLERLTFMAQIDCAEVPAGPARSLLPDKGYLYFFAPMSLNFGPDAQHFVVRYLPGPARKNWQPDTFPAVGKLADLPDDVAALRGTNSSYPRVEIDLGWLEEPTDEEVEARRAEGLPHEVAEKIRAERAAAFFGPKPQSEHQLATHNGGNAGWLLEEDFPTNRGMARTLRDRIWSHCLKQRELLALQRTAAEGDEAALQAIAERENALWSLDKRNSTAFSGTDWNQSNNTPGLLPEEKERARAFLHELLTDGLTWAEDKERPARRDKAILYNWMSQAAIKGAEAALQTEPGEDVAPIPDAIVAALARRHDAREHHLFGAGTVVQVAADDMKDRYILLLQLGFDPAMDWLIGEMGPLQYWITPEDLAAKRFENTVLTIEAY